MPDFRVLPHAPVSPTCCVFCGTDTGPFIESVPEKEIPGYGRVYVCAANEQGRAGCLVQAARLVGCYGLEQVEQLDALLDEEKRKVEALRGELSRRDEPVVIGKRELEALRAGA